MIIFICIIVVFLMLISFIFFTFCFYIFLRVPRSSLCVADALASNSYFHHDNMYLQHGHILMQCCNLLFFFSFLKVPRSSLSVADALASNSYYYHHHMYLILIFFLNVSRFNVRSQIVTTGPKR
ncbi:hypothetical protein T492DRAFT_259978 [Pavlovales sp. CCMP2436]|nr:hypothetical protein T492DRAFT_259978 [Pavlovales sp. CCMP2436]